jgi:hypothetical protein
MPDLRTWHATTTVTAVDEPVWHRDGGPEFAADSPMALTTLGPTVGPTPVLALRTLSIVGRTGPHQWHLSDLAAMHGVANNVMRHALDRLARFQWIVDAGPGEVTLHLSGNLSAGQIERLHPAIARHYLGQPAPAPTCSDQRRFPLGALLARAGADNRSHLARILGVSRAAVQAASTRGLSDQTANRDAVAAGFHPAEVWPERWVTP